MAVKINKDILIEDTNITLGNLVDMFYPVGSIYMSTKNENPYTLFGIGTWEQVKGTFVYGTTLTSGDTGTTGNGTGTATNSHTLVLSEIPSHAHSAGSYDGYTLDNASASAGTGSWYQFVRVNTSSQGLSARITTNSQGGNGGHTHNIPYFSCYIWKRTA